MASLNAADTALRALYREQEARQAELDELRELIAESGTHEEMALIRAHEARLNAIDHQIQALQTAAAALRNARQAMQGKGADDEACIKAD